MLTDQAGRQPAAVPCTASYHPAYLALCHPAAHIYNELADYERLAAAVRSMAGAAVAMGKQQDSGVPHLA